MSDAIITVENLGKRYKLRHQGQGRRYVALRDVLAQKMKAPFHFLRRGKRVEGRKGNFPSSLSDLRSPGEARSPLSALPSPRSEDFWALKDVSFEVQRGLNVDSCR